MPAKCVHPIRTPASTTKITPKSKAREPFSAARHHVPGALPHARLLHWGIARHTRTALSRHGEAWRPAEATAGFGTPVDIAAAQELTQMRLLNSRAFWDKKVKIAILTLATFIAMC